MARNAETGVSRSAETDFTTGTSVASRASRENCLKSGCSILFCANRAGRSRAFHYRGTGRHELSARPLRDRRGLVPAVTHRPWGPGRFVRGAAPHLHRSGAVAPPGRTRVSAPSTYSTPWDPHIGSKPYGMTNRYLHADAPGTLVTLPGSTSGLELEGL